MRYSVLGFSQEALMGAINQGNNMDVADLVILKWIAELSVRSSAKKKLVEDVTYVWVKYDTLLDDLPILGIKQRALKTRLDNLVGIGLLKHHHDTDKGSFSYYALTDMYESFLYDNGGYAKNCIGGMQNFAEQRPITKKPIISIEEKKKSFSEKVYAYSDKYPKEMLDKFIYYWTEKLSENSNKMRYEKQDAFEIGRRLATWASRDFNKVTPQAKPTTPKPKTELWREMGFNSYEEYKNTILK